MNTELGHTSREYYFWSTIISRFERSKRVTVTSTLNGRLTFKTPASAESRKSNHHVHSHFLTQITCWVPFRLLFFLLSFFNIFNIFFNFFFALHSSFFVLLLSSAEQGVRFPRKEMRLQTRRRKTKCSEDMNRKRRRRQDAALNTNMPIKLSYRVAVQSAQNAISYVLFFQEKDHEQPS